ncbi:MAG: hypothetical protein K5912_00200 [Alphaproteobacteria bacterium]|nr:hypothetical protein [Alphaproteobacteria bacterium]
MRKVFVSLFGIMACIGVVKADGLWLDSNDPLFLQANSEFLSKTNLYYFDNGLRFGQFLSYGFTNRFSLGASIHYQQNFDNNQDGFSSVDLGGVYRLGTAKETIRRLTYDAIFGLKFGGNRHVRMPDYADSTYYAGIRFGRQYEGMTFAGTLKSSWIFDDTRGMAFIDFIPEVYFRIASTWRIGIDADLRKATTPHYDEESLGFKLVKQYGRTQYMGRVAYEFEKEELNLGGQINIVF